MQSEDSPFQEVILVLNIATNVDTIFRKITVSCNFKKTSQPFNYETKEVIPTPTQCCTLTHF